MPLAPAGVSSSGSVERVEDAWAAFTGNEQRTLEPVGVCSSGSVERLDEACAELAASARRIAIRPDPGEAPLRVDHRLAGAVDPSARLDSDSVLDTRTLSLSMLTASFVLTPATFVLALPS